MLLVPTGPVGRRHSRRTMRSCTWSSAKYLPVIHIMPRLSTTSCVSPTAQLPLQLVNMHVASYVGCRECSGCMRASLAMALPGETFTSHNSSSRSKAQSQINKQSTAAALNNQQLRSTVNPLGIKRKINGDILRCPIKKTAPVNPPPTLSFPTCLPAPCQPPPPIPSFLTSSPHGTPDLFEYG